MIKTAIYSSIIFLLLTSFNRVMSQDLESDLVLDMGFSNEITDLTGNVIPVSTLGSETYVEDRFGNPLCAIQFYGLEGEHIEIPVMSENELINGGEAFTISLWFRMNNVEGSDYENFFEKDTTTWADNFGMGVYDGNTPLVWDKNGHAFWDDHWNADSDLHVDTINWHHLVMTVDDSIVTMYRDNEVRADYYYDYFSGEDFDIGNSAANYYLGRYLRGCLDDIKMYKRVLTDAEVSMLFELDGNCGALNVQKEKQTETTFVMNNGVASIRSMEEGRKTVTVYNAMGQIFLMENSILEENLTINLSEFSSGIYIIRVRNNDNGKLTTKKILIP